MKNFRCPLCGSEKCRVFLKNGEDFEYGIKGKFKLFRCASCGLISLFPIPTVEQLLVSYPDSYHSYNIPVSKITQLLAYVTLRQEAKKIKRLIGNKGKILDVGCADGEHFDILKKFGNWQFVGIDFNDKIVKKGKIEGREIYTTTLEEFDYPKKNFDLVIMDHLLEHVVDPVLTLRAAYSLLKSGGYLIGAAPNINSLDRILFQRFWGGFHLPRHVWHFTPTTLSKMFEKTGFNLRKLDYELHTGHWALSVQNFFQSRKLTTVKLKKGRTFYYPFLLFLFIPLNIIQKPLRCTGVMGFIAKKD